MSNQSLLRITRELKAVQRTTDLSIAVAYNDNDLHNVRAMIIGPPDTPYEFGFFEFSIRFPDEYPDKAPTVTATTTNGGRTRFNPNIYNQGKVCLSILGTWRGERGEQWSSAQGLESILISIQSLMSSNPYENEPGYEHAVEASDKKNQKEYVAKIRHETLRISVLQRLENWLGIFSDGTVAAQPPLDLLGTTELEDEDQEEVAAAFEPFKDLCKRRFLWYFSSYMAAIEEGCKKHRAGTPFSIMPFEGGSNSMDGQFDYPSLRRRTLLIQEVLRQETTRWAEEGRVFVSREHPQAAFIFRQFSQIKEKFSKNDSVVLQMGLVDDNPFVWSLSYCGRPMTSYDGGLFRIRMAISPRWPEELPRVTFETKLFHHRVGKDGTMCYIPEHPGELQSHVEGIVQALEEEHPPYDPRTRINPEAAKLFWGSESEQKQYKRMLKRTVDSSMDE